MAKIKIKYCGLLNAEDIKSAIDAEVDAVGFVFVEKSKRYIRPESAQLLVEQAKSAGLLTVALFADNDAETVLQVVEHVHPDVLQFHGAETATFCEQFNLPYWKAVPMLSTNDYRKYMAQHPKAQAYLLDAYGQQQSGGSGEHFEWFQFPNEWKHQMILAGGINADNVEQAIQATGAEFIDTSSGIEFSPGVKSRQKMLDLATKVKSIIHSIENNITQ